MSQSSRLNCTFRKDEEGLRSSLPQAAPVKGYWVREKEVFLSENVREQLKLKQLLFLEVPGKTEQRQKMQNSLYKV